MIQLISNDLTKRIDIVWFTHYNSAEISGANANVNNIIPIDADITNASNIVISIGNLFTNGTRTGEIIKKIISVMMVAFRTSRMFLWEELLNKLSAPLTFSL
jgi:hypothetical protein